MGRKAVDLTGQHFGRWTVLYRNGSDKYHNAIWHCQCECGREKDIKGYILRRGISRSCGCLQKETVSKLNKERGHQYYVGERFNHLVIKQLKDELAYCKCDCGNFLWVKKYDLLKNHTTTCGCRSWYRNPAIVDELGNQYGKLTVVEEFGRDKDKRVLWKCKCECGNYKIALGKSLRAGLVNSCGCMHSKGEQIVQNILTILNINFETQKSFPNLRSDKDYPLFFDFYLPDFNTCIEYQGEQHYKQTRLFTEEEFELALRRDELKRQYCINNNIVLIEIPYTDFEKIDEEYILKLLEDKK